MGNVVKLPDNLIGKTDREKIKSFVRRIVVLGTPTRWNWTRDATGDDILRLVIRKKKSVNLTIQISRDRKMNVFCVHDEQLYNPIACGTLEYILGELEEYIFYVQKKILTTVR